MQVCMLSLFFLCFLTWINGNRTPYMMLVLDFAIVFLENFLPVLHFVNVLREVVNVTKYLKLMKSKYLIYPFGQGSLIAISRI